MVFQSAVLWALGLGFIGVLVMIYRNTTYWRRKGLPHVESIPIFGSMGSVFLQKKSASDLAQELYYSCPGMKYFGAMDFNYPTIVIKDPEIVKEINVKSFDYFPNHRSFVVEEFDPLFSRNVFSLKDDRWREMRATLSPSFTASKMKFMFQLVSQCSNDFVQHLKEHEEITKEMDMKDVYTRYTNDVIATAAFGISVNSMKDRDNDFYTNGRDVTNFAGFTNIMKFIFSRICPSLMRYMGIGFMPGKADKFFKSLVYDTVKVRKEKGIVRPDMIHLLMQARDNENGIEMTNEDIIAQAFIFFLAGFDTSARLLCFASHVLAHHPEIQERLRKEVVSVLEEDGNNITYDTLAKMKYMDMVISETLRLYPPSPMTDRVCGQTYTLPPFDENSKGFTVQPNDSIWIPTHGFHRDPNFFPDPETFDPERFSEENKNNIAPGTYMPFGIGPRKCIGERFALMEAKVIIAHILQNFILKPSPKNSSKLIKFNPKRFLPEPMNGFWVRLEARK